MATQFRKLVGATVFLLGTLVLAASARADIALPPPTFLGQPAPSPRTTLVAGVMFAGAVAVGAYLALRGRMRRAWAPALGILVVLLCVAAYAAAVMNGKWCDYYLAAQNRPARRGPELLKAAAAAQTPVASSAPVTGPAATPQPAPAAGGEAASAPKAETDMGPVVALLELVIEADPESARKCLATIAEKIQNRELTPAQVESLKGRIAGSLDKVLTGPKDGPLYPDAALLAASWKDAAATEFARQVARDAAAPPDRRLAALNTLAFANDAGVETIVEQILADPRKNSAAFRGAAIAALARSERNEAAEALLAAYPNLEAELRPAVVETLTQRVTWAKLLFVEISTQRIPASALNSTQLLRLQQSGDSEVRHLVQAQYGLVRATRSPERESVIVEMRSLLAKTPGNAERGQVAFQKVCGQCHKIHGQGQDVGPDLTANGRASYEQLLSNVFDPSLVIGAAYQARMVVVDDGRVLTGLLVEDSEQRVVLRTQGGKEEIVAREHVEQVTVSQLSLMPEGVEKQYSPQELADLFAFLTLDKPPSDPTAVKIPGTPEVAP